MNLEILKNIHASLVEEYGSPLYVYDAQTIRSQFQTLQQSFSEIPCQFHYAMKANPNPAILNLLLDLGACIDAVSAYEAQWALDLGFTPDRILFTGNNIEAQELQFCLEKNIPVNVESLKSLETYGKLAPGSEVAVRINPGVGAGHHGHCITAGPQSKFGVYYDQLEELQQVLQQHNLKLVGIHSHIGTGILDTAPMMQALELILSVAKQLPGLQYINIGGGLGIPYRPDDHALDVHSVGQEVTRRFKAFCQEYGSNLSMKQEPGRFIVGQAGVLLATVTNVKQTPDYTFVGINTGFNHLIRPAMYDSYHQILNLSNPEGSPQEVVIAGNICESGDIFTQAKEMPQPRRLPELRVGDVVAILDAGAYGMSMSSHYNMRASPAEVLLEEQGPRLVRKRDSYEDVIAPYQVG